MVRGRPTVDEGVEGRPDGAAGIQHVVDQENPAVVDGEVDVGPAQDRLRPDLMTHEVVSIQGDVEGARRHADAADARAARLTTGVRLGAPVVRMPTSARSPRVRWRSTTSWAIRVIVRATCSAAITNGTGPPQDRCGATNGKAGIATGHRSRRALRGVTGSASTPSPRAVRLRRRRPPVSMRRGILPQGTRNPRIVASPRRGRATARCAPRARPESEAPTLAPAPRGIPGARAPRKPFGRASMPGTARKSPT